MLGVEMYRKFETVVYYYTRYCTVRYRTYGTLEYGIRIPTFRTVPYGTVRYGLLISLISSDLNEMCQCVGTEAVILTKYLYINTALRVLVLTYSVTEPL
jgi:hypothetical protein